jgi:sRNA-binding regulator protein Hfq
MSTEASAHVTPQTPEAPATGKKSGQSAAPPSHPWTEAAFLLSLQGNPVQITLQGFKRIDGVFRGFDQYTYTLRTPTGPVLIPKHAVLFIRAEPTGEEAPARPPA